MQMAKVDVEAVVVAWLNSILASGWDAYGDKPTGLDQYVLVDRTGGPRESMVLDKAEILIEVYHKTSRATAKTLALSIADQVVALEAYSADITHASVNSVVNLDDTLAQYHRYQIYCDVWGARTS
jgi:hypothetical protein